MTLKLLRAKPKPPRPPGPPCAPAGPGFAPGGGPPAWVGVQEDALLAAWPRQAMAFRLETGERIAQLALPDDAELRQTRFVVSPAGWHAIAWEGGTLRLVEVCKAGRTDTRGHYDFAFFDRSGSAGPWGFVPAGDCIDMGEGEEVACGLPPGRYRFLRASRDGHHLLVAAADQRRWRIALPEKRAWAMGREAKPKQKPADQGVVLDIGIQRLGGFLAEALAWPQGVAVIGGKLAVWHGGKGVHILDLQGEHLAWIACPAPLPRDAVLALDRDATGSPGARALIRRGSRLRSDGRGLLILDRPAARDRPELAIVLRRGRTAMWCSDGRRHGPDSLLCPAPAADRATAVGLLALAAAYAGDFL